MVVLAGRGGVVAGGGGTMGFVKPAGTPSGYIDDSLSSGMLFHRVDTGSGGLYVLAKDGSGGTLLIDPPNYFNGVSPNYYPAAPPQDPDPSLLSSGSTPYGTATLWPGAGGPHGDSYSPGSGNIIRSGSLGLVRSSVDMVHRGSGAGYTAFVTYRMQTDGNPYNLISGRGCNLDFNNDICAFRLYAPDGKVYFAWTSIPTTPFSNKSLGTIASVTLDDIHTTAVTMENTSAGVTTVTLYHDGVQQAQSTNQTVCDVSASDASFEDDYQVGAYFHTGAGQWYNVCAGSIYQDGALNAIWTPTQVSNFSANPFQHLVY